MVAGMVSLYAPSVVLLLLATSCTSSSSSSSIQPRASSHGWTPAFRVSWRVDFSAPVCGFTTVALPAAAAAGLPAELLLLSIETGDLVALDAASGTQVWQSSSVSTFGEGLSSSPVADEATNVVYVIGSLGRLYAFDLVTGAALPPLEQGSASERTSSRSVRCGAVPVLRDGELFATDTTGADGGDILVFNASARKSWPASYYSGGSCLPYSNPTWSVDMKAVCYGTMAGRICCVDPASTATASRDFGNSFGAVPSNPSAFTHLFQPQFYDRWGAALSPSGFVAYEHCGGASCTPKKVYWHDLWTATASITLLVNLSIGVAYFGTDEGEVVAFNMGHSQLGGEAAGLHQPTRWVRGLGSRGKKGNSRPGLKPWSVVTSPGFLQPRHSSAFLLLLATRNGTLVGLNVDSGEVEHEVSLEGEPVLGSRVLTSSTLGYAYVHTIGGPEGASATISAVAPVAALIRTCASNSNATACSTCGSVSLLPLRQCQSGGGGGTPLQHASVSLRCTAGALEVSTFPRAACEGVPSISLYAAGECARDIRVLSDNSPFKVVSCD